MASEAVRGKTVKLESPDGPVSGHLAVPKSGSGPGILALHAWWGLNDFFKDFCNRLATAGFVAFAPDLYHGPVASTIEQADKLSSGVKPETGRSDLAKSVKGLRAHPSVRGNRLGVIGFSFGAWWALWAAQEMPADIAAVVVFYGTSDGDFAKTRAAFLGHFAEKDPYESAESVRAFEGLLRAAGKDATIHVYPGTGHWFFEKDRPDAYNASAATMAWNRTVQFLKAHLDGKKS